ncbi:MAG: response regulator [Anaerolineae bacterium]
MKAKILVVDDDPDFVEVTRTVLEKHGYGIITAANGQEALEKAQQEVPDLILLDVMMSTVWDGVHVSDRLAEDPRLREIPVLMVSSITGTPHAAFFPTDESLSIDGWISKPVSPEALLKKVEGVLRR